MNHKNASLFYIIIIELILLRYSDSSAKVITSSFVSFCQIVYFN